jgi:hypothetical protein
LGGLHVCVVFFGGTYFRGERPKQFRHLRGIDGKNQGLLEFSSGASNAIIHVLREQHVTTGAHANLLHVHERETNPYMRRLAFSRDLLEVPNEL